MSTTQPVGLPAGWQPKPDTLKGKVILITGAGDGIGRACALACASAGATVLLLGRTQEKLNRVYDEIKAAAGPEPGAIPLNLSTARPAEFDQLANMLDAEFGRLDGLLHCAAMLGDITPLEMASADTWQQVLQVNLTAPVFLTQAMMPLLRASESASIVFASSSVGRRGRAFWGAYAVSKAGIESVTRIMADELEHTGKIRVNAVNPGATRTAMRAYAYPAENPMTLKTPEDIAPVFCWLLSDDSRDVNGASIDAQPKPLQ